MSVAFPSSRVPIEISTRPSRLFAHAAIAAFDSGIEGFASVVVVAPVVAPGVVDERWMGFEHEVMTRVWEAGAPVPYPVGFSGDGMLLEFVGDESQAAPTLGQARLTKNEMQSAAEQLVEGLRALMEVGIVHADLSAFNLLWWNGVLVFIDFPQAVDLALNPHGLEFLHRDIENVAGWFARRGVALDSSALFTDLLNVAFPPRI
jgi:RIO kinase 1